MKRKTLPEYFDWTDRNSSWYGNKACHTNDEERLSCDIDDSRLKWEESHSVSKFGTSIYYQTVFLDDEEIALERTIYPSNIMMSGTSTFIVILPDDVDEETRKSPHFTDDGEYCELHFATLQQLLDYKLKGKLVSESHFNKRAVYRINHGEYGETCGIFSKKELDELLKENPGTVTQIDAKAIAEEIARLIAKGEHEKYEAKRFLDKGMGYVEYYLQRWYGDGHELSCIANAHDSCQHDDFVAEVVLEVLENFPFKRNEYGLLKGTGKWQKEDLFYDERDATYRTLDEIAKLISELTSFVPRPYCSTNDFIEHNSDVVSHVSDEELDEMAKEWKAERTYRESLGYDCSNVMAFLHDWFRITSFPRNIACQMLA